MALVHNNTKKISHTTNPTGKLFKEFTMKHQLYLRKQRRGGGGTGSAIGNGPGVHFDMNRGAVFGDTAGPGASMPLHSGAYNRGEEEERLRYSTYTCNRKQTRAQ